MARGVGAEVGQAAGVEDGLACAAGGQAGLAGGFEAAVQPGEEGQRRRGQQLSLARRGGASSSHARGVGPEVLRFQHCRHASLRPVSCNGLRRDHAVTYGI